MKSPCFYICADGSNPIIIVCVGINIYYPAILGYHPGTRLLTVIAILDRAQKTGEKSAESLLPRAAHPTAVPKKPVMRSVIAMEFMESSWKFD